MGGIGDLAKKVYSPIFKGAGGLYSGIAGGLLGGEKPKKPKVPAPPVYDAAAAAKAAQMAALKKKQAAAAAQGYEDTVLTSPSGAGALGSAYQGSKTLTGT